MPDGRVDGTAYTMVRRKREGRGRQPPSILLRRQDGLSLLSPWPKGNGSQMVAPIRIHDNANFLLWCHPSQCPGLPASTTGAQIIVPVSVLAQLCLPETQACLLMLGRLVTGAGLWGPLGKSSRKSSSKSTTRGLARRRPQLCGTVSWAAPHTANTEIFFFLI